MKTRNLFVGLFVFAFAISSAVASKFVTIRDAYIEVQQFSGGPWVCVDSGVDCDDDGALACMVSLTTTSGAKTVRGKLVGTSCVTPIDHPTATAQPVPSGSPTYFNAR
jgi:hypothetical protein